MITAQLAGCADESTLAPALQGSQIPDPPVTFIPEDYNVDAADAAPAINRALQAAALVGGTVLLGRSRREYVFRSHIWMEGGVYGVTLQGVTRTIRLLNGGGRGFDGRASRILMRRNATLRSLRILPVDGALGELVPGVDSGADGADGSADYWVVDNCEVGGFTGIGINFGNYASYVSITNNYIHHCGDAGVQINTHCNSSLVANNRVRFNARNGIDCNGNDNVLEYNVCRHNGTQESTTDRNGILVGGILGFPCNGNKVRNNECMYNKRCGIFVGGETMTGTEVNDNVASENVGAGIMVEAFAPENRNEALTVRDNQLDANGHYGFLVNGAGRVTFSVLAGNAGTGNRPALMPADLMRRF